MEKPLISLEQYITSSGKYPERANSSELTKEVKDNAIKLLAKVNKALSDLGIKEVKISSGFRTSSANSALSNSAKKSCHLTGEAIDIVDDKNQSLCKLFTKEVLETYDLFREDSDHTHGWCHLQVRKTASGKRIFNP